MCYQVVGWCRQRHLIANQVAKRHPFNFKTTLCYHPPDVWTVKAAAAAMNTLFLKSLLILLKTHSRVHRGSPGLYDEVHHLFSSLPSK